MKNQALIYWKTLVCLGIFLPTITLAQKEEKLPPEATEYYSPKPLKVAPGDVKTPPSDAIVLFNGSDLSAWKKGDGGRHFVGNGTGYDHQIGLPRRGPEYFGPESG